MPKSKSSDRFSEIISGSEKQPDPRTESSSGSSKRRRLGKNPEPSLSVPMEDIVNLDPPINPISDENNKKLDILNKQNCKIINKVDKLSSLIESLEDRLANIEEKFEDIKDMYDMRTRSDDKTNETFISVIKSFFSNIL